jgi:hypothetical protein
MRTDLVRTQRSMNDFVQANLDGPAQTRVVTYSLDSGSAGSDWVSSGSIGSGSVRSGYAAGCAAEPMRTDLVRTQRSMNDFVRSQSRMALHKRGLSPTRWTVARQVVTG